MESTLQKPALVAAAHKRTGRLVAVVRDLIKTTPKAKTIVYWIVTALFCLQMSFTAYAQLRLPQVAGAFSHLGFPAYFRVELSWAKLLGVVLMLAPVPSRLKEWAYAGFAITLASALIAHVSVGDGPDAWGWAAATGVLWALSYFFWRRLQAGFAERSENTCASGRCK
ncbi:MAG TPA: DoxX family protein [Acidobacteriaceae bacterium]|nr:DoxX family protein [Acidobacteriaceae bacterium]